MARCSREEKLHSLRQLEPAQDWQETTCHAIKCLDEEEDLEMQAAALHCVCVVLLSTASSEQLHSLVSDVHLKVTQIFALSAKRCLDILQRTSSSSDGPIEVGKTCEHLQVGVVSLLKCHEVMKVKLKSDAEVLASFTTILTVSCEVVDSMLSLCKDIESHYPSAFTGLASQLGALFKSTYSLLKAIMESLNVVSPEQMDQVTELLSRLQSVCRAVLRFDASLILLAWKTLGRLVCQVKRHLPEEWSIQPIIGDLCVAMETKSRECVQCAPNEAPNNVFPKLLKSCRFLGTILLKLVQEFEETSYEYASDIFSLLLNVYCSLPPSPEARVVSRTVQAELESSILLMSEPLTSALLNCQEFLKLLTSKSAVREGRQYGWAMCVCSLLKLFPKLPEGLQDFVMDSDSSLEGSTSTSKLLDAAFTSVRICYVECHFPVRVPGIMCNGQPRSDVTLYEHVCVHLSALVACLPARHFQKLEKVLLRNLLSHDLNSALLASDVWCFMARWGSSELCSRHTHLLAKLVLTLPEICLPLCALTSRMVGLLGESQQVEFVQTFPPSIPENLKLWSHITMASLNAPMLTEVCQKLVASCSQLLRRQLQRKLLDHSTHLALRGLTAVYELPSSHKLLPPPLHTSTVTITMQLWGSVVTTNAPTENKACPTQLSCTLCCDLVHLVSLLLVYLQPHHTIKVFTSLSMIADAHPPPSLSLAITRFLSHCSALQVPTGIQAQVVHSLVSLFHRLLSSTHWLVHHLAMEAFRAFAEVTPYADAVERCIPPQLSDTVIDFLNKVPYHTGKKPSLTQPQSITKELQRRAGSLSEWSQTTPTKEDLRSTNQLDQSCYDAVRLLQSTWQRITTHSSPLPEGALDELRTLSTNIQHYITTHTHHSQPLT